MEELLRAHLLANGGVTALVGRRGDWGAASPTLPAFRMLVVSAPRTRTFAGPVAYVPYRVQIDCFGTTYDVAKKLARAVDNALLTAPSKCDLPFLAAERDGGDKDAADQPIARTSLDFLINYRA